MGSIFQLTDIDSGREFYDPIPGNVVIEYTETGLSQLVHVEADSVAFEAAISVRSIFLTLQERLYGQPADCFQAQEISGVEKYMTERVKMRPIILNMESHLCKVIETTMINASCFQDSVQRDMHWITCLSLVHSQESSENFTGNRLRQHDFIKMVENLEWYMHGQIVELYGEENYPVGFLNDIKIHFRHYDNFDEAVLKWEKRKKRINWDNLFIIGDSRNEDYEVIQRFDRLPYKNKVIFSLIPYPEFKSFFYVKAFKKKWGVMTDFKNQFLKRRYLDDFDYIAFLNGMLY